MTDKTKQDARRRLARMTGQLAGINRMVEDERYCVDILTQVAALRAALDQFGVLMLSTHIEGCVYGNGDMKKADNPGASAEERLDEIKVTLNRFLK